MENYFKKKMMATLFNGYYIGLGIGLMDYYPSINDTYGDSIKIHGMNHHYICTYLYFILTPKNKKI